MKLAPKTLQALSVLLDLELNAPGAELVRAPTIAARTGIPEKYLESLLLDLRRAGLVESKRGPDGGHRLAVDPELVTFGAVVRACEGGLLEVPRQTRATPDARFLEGVWSRLEQAIREVLDSVTLEAFARSSRPTPLDYSI